MSRSRRRTQRHSYGVLNVICDDGVPDVIRDDGVLDVIRTAYSTSFVTTAYPTILDTPRHRNYYSALHGTGHETRPRVNGSTPGNPRSDMYGNFLLLALPRAIPRAAARRADRPRHARRLQRQHRHVDRHRLHHGLDGGLERDEVQRRELVGGRDRLPPPFGGDDHVRGPDLRREDRDGLHRRDRVHADERAAGRAAAHGGWSRRSTSSFRACWPPSSASSSSTC